MIVETSYENVETLGGKKVKINVDRILSYKNTSTRFSNFLNKNKDKVFTAVDTKYGTKFTGVMYELEEDDTPVKWLFYTDDLIVAEE